MHAAARRTDEFDQALFQSAVHIFLLELDGPLAVRVPCTQRFEPGTDRGAVLDSQQALLAEHTRVCDRRANVIFDEAFVQTMILARREPQDSFIERCSFVPQARHRLISSCFAPPDSGARYR